jgi:hypothetical protein
MGRLPLERRRGMLVAPVALGAPQNLSLVTDVPFAPMPIAQRPRTLSCKLMESRVVCWLDRDVRRVLLPRHRMDAPARASPERDPPPRGSHE